jgi:peptidoglycan/xylan/chitin deacetylase (PgdA/CDA1 family)
MPWKETYTISDEISLADTEAEWPQQKRCAVHLVVNLSPASGPEGISAADLTQAQAQFGAREGLDLLLAALDRHHLKATFAVPGLIAEIDPERMESILARGHEIAALGLMHEDVSLLTRRAEAARLGRTTEILTRVTGKRPEGWFALPRQGDRYGTGTISDHTVDLLMERGYRYMGNSLADDAPHYWVTDVARRRALLALPYHYLLDDQYFCMFPPDRGTGMETSDQLARNWRAEFEAQYRRGRFFSMVMHPAHVAWSNRMLLLNEFLAHMTTFPDLWVATGAECARYWQERYPVATHLKL